MRFFDWDNDPAVETDDGRVFTFSEGWREASAEALRRDLVIDTRTKELEPEDFAMIFWRIPGIVESDFPS